MPEQPGVEVLELRLRLRRLGDRFEQTTSKRIVLHPKSASRRVFKLDQNAPNVAIFLKL